MVLKPLDLVVCLELAAGGSTQRTYAELALAVGLSASEANGAVQRAIEAGLLVPAADRAAKPRANARALLEFLEHGVRYAFAAVPGKIVRGVPTGRSAPPLDAMLQGGGEPPLVWADGEGTLRGQSIEPLYKTVPAVARANPRLHELLALVDAIRCGGARERKLAMQELERRILDGSNA
jgi:hypothetical protein